MGLLHLEEETKVMNNQDGAICGRENAGLVPDGRKNKHGLRAGCY